MTAIPQSSAPPRRLMASERSRPSTDLASFSRARGAAPWETALISTRSISGAAITRPCCVPSDLAWHAASGSMCASRTRHEELPVSRSSKRRLNLRCQ